MNAAQLAVTLKSEVYKTFLTIMAPKLYTMAMSAPVRSVLLTAKAINLELEIITLDPFKGEHLSPEFLKINPQHKVPTLVDDGFIVWDSHAINSYLVQKYGKDDSLYPKDLQKRAHVDQQLYFDCGVLQPGMTAIMAPIVRDGAKRVPKDKSDQLIQAYTTLETALEGKKFVAGDTMTIADFNVVSTLTACASFAPIAANRFPKITEWLTQMQSLPYYKEASQTGLDLFAAFVKSKLN